MINPAKTAVRFVWLCTLIFAGVFSGGAAGQELSGESLARALRNGGYIIYFRHAATDWQGDDRIDKTGDWKSCDPAQMRQLSDAGRATARRIGKAIRALDIPIAKVLSSEYCRSAETARLLALGPVSTTRDIMNMLAADYVGGREAVIHRARRVLSAPPPAGANVVVVGHGNLMLAASGAYAGEGGSGIYLPNPGSDSGFKMVARLSPKDWAQLADRLAGDS